jgi:hypothetical protein
MASGSVRMAGAARASKVCDRCAVVRRECVAKGWAFARRSEIQSGRSRWSRPSGVVQSAMYGLSHGPRRAGGGQRAADWGDAGLGACGIQVVCNCAPGLWGRMDA